MSTGDMQELETPKQKKKNQILIEICIEDNKNSWLFSILVSFT